MKVAILLVVIIFLLLIILGVCLFCFKCVCMENGFKKPGDILGSLEWLFVCFSYTRCVTVQHKDVIEELFKKGMYEANIRRVPDNRVKPYQMMCSAYEYYNSCPIFMAPVGKKVEFYGIKTDSDYYMIELKIPTRFCRLQEYYDWTDLIYFTENQKEFNEGSVISFGEFCNRVFSKSFNDKVNVSQITTEYILKSCVKDTKPIKESFIKRHVGSGGKNVLRRLSYYQ